LKANVINDDLVLIDDFLNNDEFVLIKSDIINEKKDIKIDKHPNFKDTKYNRVYLDNKYDKRRHESLILTLIQGKLFSEETISIAKGIHSYPFQVYKELNFHQTQLTVYGEGGRYDWHIDYCNGRVLSYVLPVQVTNKKMWSGGSLIFKCKGGDKTIEPKNNQLILFSGHLMHKVTPIKIKDNDGDILSGRVVINGHIGVDTVK
jgi:Rps23 Pro-64 3,4-dihydroxylase Tpa1-like proline 4-hydroxylase